MNIEKKKGFSLIETLVAVALFAIVATISTQAFSASLRNARKSQSLGEVRENVDYAMNSMERLLRNAQDLNCSGSTPSRLVYEDEYGVISEFECISDHIASGSASLRITSEDVEITNCSSMFVCSEGVPGGIPDSVTINVSAQDADYAGTQEGAVVTSQTNLLLRVYD